MFSWLIDTFGLKEYPIMLQIAFERARHVLFMYLYDRCPYDIRIINESMVERRCLLMKELISVESQFEVDDILLMLVAHGYLSMTSIYEFQWSCVDYNIDTLKFLWQNYRVTVDKLPGCFNFDNLATVQWYYKDRIPNQEQVELATVQWYYKDRIPNQERVELAMSHYKFKAVQHFYNEYKLRP